MRIYQRRVSRQAMHVAINRLESLKSQTTAGSDEEAYYQTMIDRYNQIIAV